MPGSESYITDCMNTSCENTYIYAFPPFSIMWSTIKKIEKKADIDNCANVANTDLVHTGTRISNSNIHHYRESTPPSARHQQTTHALSKTEADGYMLLQASTNLISEIAHKIISAAWTPQTKRKYKSIFKKWEELCAEQSISTMRTDEINVIKFLTEEYERGLPFGRIYICTEELPTKSHTRC